MAEYSYHLPYGQLVSACSVLFGKGYVTSIPTLQVEEIKHAYRRAVKRVHPDAAPDNSTATFRRVTEAYELLLKHVESRRIAQQKPKQVRPHGRNTKNAATQPPATDGARSTPKRPPQALKSPKRTMYSGPMPTIPLKIGLYLYYTGKIPYETLVQALVWQQSMRPQIGRLAQKAKLLTTAEVERILDSKTVCGQFGERAVKLGFLAESQVAQLLRLQRSLQKPLGTYFVKKKLLTTYELSTAAHDMEQHNQHIFRERHDRQLMIEQVSKPDVA